jgi:hypothetical protein
MYLENSFTFAQQPRIIEINQIRNYPIILLRWILVSSPCNKGTGKLIYNVEI